MRCSYRLKRFTSFTFNLYILIFKERPANSLIYGHYFPFAKKNIDPIMLRLKLKEGMEAEILSHLSPLILSPQFNCLKNCNEKSDTPLISEIGKVGQQANYREAFQCLDNFH